MRLRAVLDRQKKFLEVVRTLQKMSKVCTMRISPADVVLAVNPGSLTEAQVWASLKSEARDGTGVFKTLRIESLQRNQIAFDIDLSLLERALKSCEPAEMASLKLSKKGASAFLCFEIITQGVPMMTIIQDVPITVLSGEEVAAFHEPVVATPAVQLVTPPLKSLFGVMERLKGLDSRVLLKANMMGELTLGIETDLVFLNNVWTDLLPPGADGGRPAAAEDSSRQGEATIDAALLAKLLSCHHLRPTSSFCCIGEKDAEKLLIWHLIIGEDTVTYYLPVKD